MFIISFTRVRWGDPSSDHNPQAGTLCRGRGSADACWGPGCRVPPPPLPVLVHRAQLPPAEQPTGQGTGGWEDSDLGDGGWEDSVTLELTAQGSKLSAK